MQDITLNDVDGLQKHDRISVTYLNKDGEEITKNTRFHSIDDNIIIVYQPRKQKTAWEIPIGSECIIRRL
jgi:hypothetical protein